METMQIRYGGSRTNHDSSREAHDCCMVCAVAALHTREQNSTAPCCTPANCPGLSRTIPEKRRVLHRRAIMPNFGYVLELVCSRSRTMIVDSFQTIVRRDGHRGDIDARARRFLRFSGARARSTTVVYMTYMYMSTCRR